MSDPTVTDEPWERGRGEAARRFADRVVDDGVEGLLVDGEQVPPFRPEDYPRGPDDQEWPDRL